jgi:hypothetical protein
LPELLWPTLAQKKNSKFSSRIRAAIQRRSPTIWWWALRLLASRRSSTATTLSPASREERLGGLIAESDTVVVVSPEAVKSEPCIWEVDRTTELSKRLFPVIYKPVPEHDVPQKLTRLQFVHFDGEAGFVRPLSQLVAALRVDLDWIREQTRLGELATRWNARGRPESLLLRGDQLDAATAWVARRKPTAPEIVDVLRLFISTSETSEVARLRKERAQIETIRKQQRRAAWLLSGIAALVAAMIGYVTWQGYDVARREINVFTGRAVEALNNEQFDRAMRYVLQAYPARGRFPWTTPFPTELEGKLLAGGAQSTRLYRLLKGHSARVEGAVFSPMASAW